MKRRNQLQSLGLILLLIVTLFSLAVAALTELDALLGSPIEVIAEHGVGDGHVATEVPIGEVVDLTVDAAGTVYLVDSVHMRVRRVNPEGSIDTVFNSYAQDSLSAPRAVAVDNRSGAIFVADVLANRIWMIRDHDLSVFAGSGVCGDSGDIGPATEAAMHSPTDLAVGSDGTLYVADHFNNRIRAIDPTGMIRTVAGGPRPRKGAAQLFQPELVDVASDGTLYVVDVAGRRLQRVSPDGSAREISGLPGTISSISVTDREGLLVVSAGSVYWVDGSAQPLRITARDEPRVRVIATFGGDLIASSRGEHHVYRITDGNVRTVLAGNGTAGRFGDGGPAYGATFSCHDVATDEQGRLFFSDPFNRRIAVIEPDGKIATVAGTDETKSGGVRFNRPAGLARTADGSLLVADRGAHQVVGIAPDGHAYVIAGNGTAGLAGDGESAPAALLDSPSDVAVSGAGDVFISDQRNQRIRRVDSSGVIATVGILEEEPTSVAVDGDGNVVVALMGRPEPRIMQDTDDAAAISVAQDVSRPDVPASGTAGLAIGAGGRLLVASGGRILGPVGVITDKLLTAAFAPAIPISVPGLAIASNGDIILCDNARQRILRVRASTVLASSGS